MLATLTNYIQKKITLDLCSVVGGRRPSVINYHHNGLSLKFDIKDFFYGAHLPKLVYTSGMNGHFSKSKVPLTFGTV